MIGKECFEPTFKVVDFRGRISFVYEITWNKLLHIRDFSFPICGLKEKKLLQHLSQSRMKKTLRQMETLRCSKSIAITHCLRKQNRQETNDNIISRKETSSKILQTLCGTKFKNEQ